MLRSGFLTLILIILNTTSFGQIKRNAPLPPPKKVRNIKPADTVRPVVRPNTYLGLGVGLDYGGLGLHIEYLPVNFLGIFGGVGYNLGGAAGINGGLTFRAFPMNAFRPMVTAMYGYNAVLIVKGTHKEPIKRSSYFGFSFGGGFEVDVNRRRTNKLNLQLLVPVRDKRFEEDVTKYQAEMPSPVLFSLGFNFGI